MATRKLRLRQNPVLHSTEKSCPISSNTVRLWLVLFENTDTHTRRHFVPTFYYSSLCGVGVLCVSAKSKCALSTLARVLSFERLQNISELEQPTEHQKLLNLAKMLAVEYTILLLLLHRQRSIPSAQAPATSSTWMSVDLIEYFADGYGGGMMTKVCCCPFVFNSRRL